MQNSLNQDKCRSLLLDALQKGKGTRELARMLNIPETMVIDNIKLLKTILEKQAEDFGISADDYLKTLEQNFRVNDEQKTRWEKRHPEVEEEIK